MPEIYSSEDGSNFSDSPQREDNTCPKQNTKEDRHWKGHESRENSDYHKNGDRLHQEKLRQRKTLRKERDQKQMENILRAQKEYQKCIQEKEEMEYITDEKEDIELSKSISFPP